MTERRDRAADDLEADGQIELANDVRAGRCACGCKQLLAARSGRTLYADARHRQRAYRRRLETRARAAGIEPRLTLETVQAAESTSGRHRDAQNGPAAPLPAKPRKPRAPRPGVSVYFPTLAVAEAARGILYHDERGLSPEEADALDALEAALERRRRRAA